jgi:NAD(P)-dependent dehydrogenase (short-subunit alcohol dehydrogenase family)
MHRRLAGQIAWISGAASGIGEATAILFAEEGANVAMIDINVHQGGFPRGPAIEDSGGGRAVFIQADVSDEEQVRDSMAQTAATFGGPDIIVNCAGIVHVKPLHQYEEAEWDRLMGSTSRRSSSRSSMACHT